MAVNISLLNLRVVREKSGRYDLDDRKISSVDKLYKIATEVLEMDQRAEEIFCVVCADAQHRINGIFEVFRGGISEAPISPREIFKRALLQNAFTIFLLHNHPGGSLLPSSADVETTKRLVEIGKLIGIPVTDHLIVAENRYLSFREQCLI